MRILHSRLVVLLSVLLTSNHCLALKTRLVAAEELPEPLTDATSLAQLESSPLDVARLAADSQRIEYLIGLETGNDATATTKSSIYLTVHGTEGDTGEFALSNEKSPQIPLSKGTMSNLTKSLKDVGTLTKVRIRNAGEDDWECKSIVIQKVDDGTTTKFEVNKWIVSPKQATRWAYAEVTYMLMVETGSDDNAGTVQPVYVIIYGSQGSSGKLELASALQKSTTVGLTLKARDIGIPSSIMLTNPNSDEWYCTEIKLTSSRGTFVFTADKWVVTPQHPSAFVAVDKSYGIYIESGGEPEDGTEGAVSIQLFGVEGASAIQFLSSGISPGKSSMEVTTKDVGRLTKIKLSTQSTDSWNCKTLDIKDSAGSVVHFDVDGGLQAPVASTLSVFADVPYSILVKTSDSDNAGSTGGFSINIYGTLGVTRTLSLSPGGFMNNSDHRVSLEAKDVGDLTKIRLSTRSPDGWKCKDVTITKDGKIYPFSVDKLVQFPLAATIDTNADIKYTFTVVTGKETGAGTTAMIYITLYGESGQSRYLPLKTGFASGSTNTVTFKTQDVGRLTRIKLTSSDEDDWLCEDISVKYNGDEARFDVGKWVAFPEVPNIYVDQAGLASQ